MKARTHGLHLPLALLLTLVPPVLAQSWVQLQPQGTPPPGRINNTSVYDPISDRMIVFGGNDIAVCCESANDLWILTSANGRGGWRSWIQELPKGASGSPPPTAAASAVYDPLSNRMIVFGGQVSVNGTGVSSPQLWILRNANGWLGTPSWYQPAVNGGPPPARQNHQAVYDPKTNRMIVVGGLKNDGSNVTLLNDVWVLTNANGTGPEPSQWIQLSISGIGPSPRHAFAAAYDVITDRLSIFGGCVDPGFTCDNLLASTELWVLSNANGVGGPTPSWQVFRFPLAPNAHAQYAVGGYDPLRNDLYVMGGRTGATPPFGMFTNFTWALSHANGLGGTPQWTMLTPGGQLPAERGQSVPPDLFDPVSGNLMVFGGPGLNDTWSLSTRGRGFTDPDERRLGPKSSR
jgi:Galactose oxidase, central domain